MTRAVHIVALNWETRSVLLSDDSELPITHMYDDDGDETDKVEEAVTFVCGSPSQWFRLPRYLFKPAVLN